MKLRFETNCPTFSWFPKFWCWKIETLQAFETHCTKESSEGPRNTTLLKSQFHFLIASSLSDGLGYLHSNRASKSDRLLASERAKSAAYPARRDLRMRRQLDREDFFYAPSFRFHIISIKKLKRIQLARLPRCGVFPRRRARSTRQTQFPSARLAGRATWHKCGPLRRPGRRP